MPSNERSGGEVQVVTLRVPIDLYEKIRTVAFATGTSINALAISILTKHAIDDASRPALDELGKRVKSVLEVDLDKLRT